MLLPLLQNRDSDDDDDDNVGGDDDDDNLRDAIAGQNIIEANLRCASQALASDHLN